ncbi:hypothetical protein [Aestuariirhabdus litorea]|uniref:Uncharacterized protein n=1 Tax=Aestuariirhabdus litorea TaxID=2528527 RepID=A0A3P3VIK8_9GAMM|nr:hypothetical protein [Aestuariirhabdus litorea]RRJ82571.1 hypothetical protein D0544_11935 [Aestuariirhabdus litorea]RWW92730.1 hypothetical protein DZC74_11910 [Endozoicomonadaceae bacterium GTF-13]
MSVNAIRDLIANASKQEEANHYLQSHLASLKNGLHPLLGLDHKTANEHLLEFCTRYINYVPNFIEVMEQGAKRSRIESVILPFVDIAKEYFLNPSPAIAGHQGLIGLMDEAYLCHRLFEEVNDMVWNRGGYPMLPLDTSQANVIAHAIVGEPFANELDALVMQAVSGLASRFETLEQEPLAAFFEENARQWETGGQEWPCLASEMGLDFKLRQRYLKAI